MQKQHVGSPIYLTHSKVDIVVVVSLIFKFNKKDQIVFLFIVAVEYIEVGNVGNQ
jgi:hypothetical protein